MFDMTPFEWIYVFIFFGIIIVAAIFLKKSGTEMMNDDKDKPEKK